MVLLAVVVKNATSFDSDTAKFGKEEPNSALGGTVVGSVKITRDIARNNTIDEKQDAFDSKVEMKLESPSDKKSYDASDGSPKRFFVKTKGGKKNRVIFDIKKSRGKVHHVLENLEVVVVSFDNSTDVSSFEDLGYDSNVMEPDPPRYVSGMRGFTSKKHRSLQDQTVPWGLNTVFQDVLHLSDPTKVQKHICIIDGGFDSNHPDLQGIEVTSGDGELTAYDGCDHGTHVAGTIVANNNNIGSLGIYPGAPVMLVRVFTGTECKYTFASDLAVAANSCYRSGARIINISAKGPGFSSTEESVYYLLRQLGVLVFAAAGNDALKGNPLIYPAGYSNVISVAAIDFKSDRAPFSIYNSEVDIAAPGVNIFSTIGNGGYGYWAGTSMACPFASGLAFSLWNEFPDSSSEDIRNAILYTAKDIGNKGKDIEFGYGLIQYWPARSYLTSLAPKSEIFKLCQDFPCADDEEETNFYVIGNLDLYKMPPQIGDNALSYVYIPSGWTFQFYEHSDFGGKTQVYGEYDRSAELKLTVSNDIVSSVKLRQFRTSEKVLLCLYYPCGTKDVWTSRTGNWEWADQFSYIWLPAGYSITFYAEKNYVDEIGSVSATEDAIPFFSEKAME